MKSIIPPCKVIYSCWLIACHVCLNLQPQLYLHVWLLDERWDRGYWFWRSIYSQSRKAVETAIPLLEILTPGPRGRESSVLPSCFPSPPCRAHSLQLFTSKLSESQMSNDMKLHNYAWVSSQGTTLIRYGSLKWWANTCWFSVFAPLSLARRSCFHCPLCMSVILSGIGSPVSGCTEGSLVGPGQGKMPFRACLVKAASPSVELGNALKVHHWQAPLEKCSI